MTVRRILNVGLPADLAVLKRASAPVARVDDAVRALADDMLETMYDAPGIGLAAIQVGEPVRLVVMDLAREEAPKAPRVFVNPEITWASEELAAYDEGCLSIPEIFDTVERPARVRVRFTDREGVEHEEEAEGLYGRCAGPGRCCPGRRGGWRRNGPRPAAGQRQS